MTPSKQLTPADKRALAAIARRRRKLDADIAVAIKRATANGASAGQIADVVGMSRAQAHRYGRGDYDHLLADDT